MRINNLILILYTIKVRASHLLFKCKLMAFTVYDLISEGGSSQLKKGLKYCGNARILPFSFHKTFSS